LVSGSRHEWLVFSGVQARSMPDMRCGRIEDGREDRESRYGDMLEPGMPNQSPGSMKRSSCQAISGHAEAWRIPLRKGTPVDEISAGANHMVKAVPRSRETNIDLG